MSALTKNAYPEFGTTVTFTIVDSLKRIDAFDMYFHVAKIRLNNGEETFATFSEDEYFRIKNRNEPVEAKVCHQVFTAPVKPGEDFQIHSFGEPSEQPRVALMLKVHPQHLSFSDRQPWSADVRRARELGLPAPRSPFDTAMDFYNAMGRTQQAAVEEIAPPQPKTRLRRLAARIVSALG